MQALGYIEENGMYRGTVALDMKAIADTAFDVTNKAFLGLEFDPHQYVEYSPVGPNNVAEWITKYESVM